MKPLSSRSNRSLKERVQRSSESDLVPYEKVIDLSGLKSAMKVLYKNRERRIIEFEEILRNLFVNSNRKKISDNRLKSYK